MIPKTIHYCWFGGGKKPFLIRKCIESWHRFLPDWKFVEWNENNFDVNCIPFIQQAYEERKWAFVADYCRFYAVYNHGGVYLDTDVEVKKNLDIFLENDCFAGTEHRITSAGNSFISVDASMFGGIKRHWYIKECLDFYKDKNFRQPDGSITGGVVQGVATDVLLPLGYQRMDKTQIIKDVKIYSSEFFTNKYTIDKNRKPYTIHHFDGSWTDDPQRGLLFKLCRKYDLMHWYRALESLRNRIIHK